MSRVLKKGSGERRLTSKTFVVFNPAHLVESVFGILHNLYVLFSRGMIISRIVFSHSVFSCRYSDHEFSCQVSFKLFLMINYLLHL